VEEIVVTRLWMAGVVTAMVIFGVAAFVGYRRRDKQNGPGPE
jgi:hypothetical protein